MRPARRPRHRGIATLLRTILAAQAGLWSADALACTVASPPSTSIGSHSPAAVKAGVVPAVSLSAGINCGTTVLTLFGGNTFRATLTSANNFALTAAAPNADTASYKVYVDTAATRQMAVGTPTNFLDPQIIDLLGLLGASPSMIPLYVKPSSITALTPGLYNGSFALAWTWKFCSIAWVGGACLGTKVEGSGNATIAFTMTVAAKPIAATISSATTWDPISGTANPKAIVASKRRTSITLTNPDIVAADVNTVTVTLATPAGTMVALDGDGSTNATVVQTAQGTPASGLTLSYVGPADTGDGVDFSSNNGTSWAYAPTAGNAASQRAVTTIRFRPQGTMAAGSSFTISLPYAVR